GRVATSSPERTSGERDMTILLSRRAKAGPTHNPARHAESCHPAGAQLRIRSVGRPFGMREPMGKHAAGTHNRPAAGHRSFALRPATVILSGAVCAAVVGTTPAVADDRPVGTPVGALPALPGAQGLAPGSGPLDTWAFGAPTLAQADVLAQVYTGAPGPARTVLESLGYAPLEAATTP